MGNIIWHDKTEPLPGENEKCLIVVLIETGEYLLRPLRFIGLENGELRTVGRNGRGNAVDKFAVIPRCDDDREEWFVYEDCERERGVWQ